jgi:hypothetical protein
MPVLSLTRLLVTGTLLLGSATSFAATSHDLIRDLPLWASTNPTGFEPTKQGTTFVVTHNLKIRAKKNHVIGFMATKKYPSTEFAVLKGPRYEVLRAISKPVCSLYGDYLSTRSLSLHRGEKLKMRDGSENRQGKGIEMTLDSTLTGRTFFIWCRNIDSSSEIGVVQNLLDRALVVTK